MTKSVGEETLALHLNAYKIDFEREYRFCPDRRWRADFFLPQYKTLIEVEGGTRSKGRHSRHAGFTNDCEKYNAAILLGYRLLRYTTEMVTSGAAINQIRAAL